LYRGAERGIGRATDRRGWWGDLTIPAMQPIYLQIILQALSSFAIAGGLIFTAVQFRSARRAQHVANFAKMVELQFQLRKMRVDDPSLARVYKHDVEDLNDDEEIRFYFMNLMQLSIFEIVWFAHKHGQIPDDYFESWVKRMVEIEREDSFRQMIRNPSMKILHDEFQRYITRMTATVNKDR
jgi:hypothetical protein